MVESDANEERVRVRNNSSGVVRPNSPKEDKVFSIVGKAIGPEEPVRFIFNAHLTL